MPIFLPQIRLEFHVPPPPPPTLLVNSFIYYYMYFLVVLLLLWLSTSFLHMLQGHIKSSICQQPWEQFIVKSVFRHFRVEAIQYLHRRVLWSQKPWQCRRNGGRFLWWIQKFLMSWHLFRKERWAREPQENWKTFKEEAFKEIGQILRKASWRYYRHRE